jgi:hypothetical protein
MLASCFLLPDRSIDMSNLSILLSQAETESRLREAQARRGAALNRRHARSAGDHEVVVRLADGNDRAAIARLAQLEGRRLPPGATLVAERGGELLAAISIDGGEAIADPFRRTAPLVDLLLRSRAELCGETDARHRRRPWAILRRLVSPRRRSPATPAVPGSEYC